MKKIPFNVYGIIATMIIITLILLVVQPFSLVDFEQVQRIAKWKNYYEKLTYLFDLVKLHEGTIVPDSKTAGVIVSEEFMMSYLKPYFNYEYALPTKTLKYSYRKLNNSGIKRQNQFYFNKFVRMKTGELISIKRNNSEIKFEDSPEYYMFIDINGEKRPNRIGKDIFMINIYKDRISPLGEGKINSKIKISCSPIGNGLYCADSYLLGGNI